MIIAVEGVNGSGKSTLSQEIVDRLRAEGVDAELAKLPGEPSIEVCKQVRAILDVCEFKGSMTKFFLYLADMGEWYAHLDDKKIYILDRSHISTLVYQQNDGVDRYIIENCLDDAGIYLDAAILLTVDAEVAHKRLETRTEKTLANYKNRDVEFYESLQEGYLEEFLRCKRKFPTYQIDTTNKSEGEVLSEALEFVIGKL